MNKENLPPGLFDRELLASREYQIGKLAWVALLIGCLAGGFLLARADYSSLSGRLRAFAGLIVIAGAVWLARRLWRMI